MCTIKKIGIICSLLFFYLSVFGQTIELDSIDVGRFIISNDSIIIISGTTKTKNNQYRSSLRAFDINLNQKWNYVLNDSEVNIIDKANLYNNEIVISGLIGKRTNTTSDTKRFVRFLNLNGEIIFNKELGLSDLSSTNILLKDKHLYFGFHKNSTTKYDINLNTDICLIKLNLDSKNTSYKSLSIKANRPDKIVLKNDEIFMFGEKYGMPNQIFTKKFSSSSSHNLIPLTENEFLFNSIVYNKGFIIISYSNPSIEDKEKYLKFTYLDNNAKFIKHKTLEFKNLNWKEMALYSQSYLNELWFLVTKNDNKYYFVRLDNNGKELECIESIELLGIYDFYISKEFIYYFYKNNNKSYITILKR